MPASTIADEVRAAAPPGSPAVASGDATLSYAELLAGADELAGALRAQGLQTGALVGVCLPRSAALVVADLGVLAAGGAYVALDPAQPAERLRGLLADSGVSSLVTDATTAAALGAGDGEPVGPSLLVSTGGPGRVAEPGLAYVMYTSGSTGDPKGVMVEGAGLRNLVAWHRRAFDVRPGTRCSQVAGVGFDACAWETWGTLAAGGELVIPPEPLKTDPAGMRDWLAAERIEVAFLPTPLAEAVVSLAWPRSVPLRVLLTGGDRLHAAPPAGLPFSLVNNYGLTEASVVTTSGVVAPAGQGLPSIGAPIDGVRIRVVDQDLRDTEVGELLVGGVSVARGYLGAPALTAARFVERDGDRWYRTGDRVTRLADGTVSFAGRLDDQIQVRGFRVEPAEIEAALLRHPGVTQASVRVVDGRLVGWVQGGDVTDAALREHLAVWLPTHMIPADLVPVAALPLTPSGKVDVAALPRPAAARDVEVPTDAVEEAVAAMVAELLGLPGVGAEEN
ncbi:MAG: amino acid adenylation domain-containing protein, partial [Mycobacteriales bacterium]